MVEQENSQVSPAFPYSQDSSARLEKDIYNPWFMINSKTILNEKPLFSSTTDVEENYSNMMQDNFLEEHDESNLTKAITKLEEWSQPMSEMFPATYDPYFEVNSPLSFWGACPLDLDTMKMDDVFQVDKDDLVQSPTLAELNANDESLFDSFDCFADFIPNGNKAVNKQLLMQDFNPDFNIAFNNADNPKNISCSASSVSMKEQVFPQKHESLKKQASKTIDKQLLVQDLNQDFNIAFNNAGNPKNTSCSSGSVTKSEQVFPEKNESLKKLLSHHSSKEIFIKPKPQTGLHDKLHTVPASTDDSKKMKKSPKPQLNVDCDNKDSTLAKASVEQMYVAPCTSNNPETAPDSEDDSEMDGDFSSDADDDSEDETRLFSMKHTFVNKGSLEKKGPRYFWQYNIQSKGPKGPAMKLSEKCSNALDVKGVADPIFSPECPVDGVKHSGKARRGDGNDLTPNPKKLYSIGKELEKLNNLIDGLVPVNELPVNARIKSRKEKNKLASRACRLKKKAQHEANKLKLFGLQEEQKHLLMLTKEVKKLVKARVLHFKQNKSQSTLAAIESLQNKKAVTKVAGCSSEFVSDVLKRVASGDESGGLTVIPVHEN